MAERLAALPPTATVVDVGGGRVPFRRLSPSGKGDQNRRSRRPPRRARCEHRRRRDDVADVTRRMPFESGSVDVVASEAVLEHLTDIELHRRFRACHEAGRALHQPVLVEVLTPRDREPDLPEAWSSRLLRTLVPGAAGSASGLTTTARIRPSSRLLEGTASRCRACA